MSLALSSLMISSSEHKKLDGLGQQACKLCLTVAGQEPQGLPWGCWGRGEQGKAEPGGSVPIPTPPCFNQSHVAFYLFYTLSFHTGFGLGGKSLRLRKSKWTKHVLTPGPQFPSE